MAIGNLVWYAAQPAVQTVVVDSYEVLREFVTPENLTKIL